MGRDSDTRYSFHDKIRSDLSFIFPNIAMAEQKLAVQIWDIYCVFGVDLVDVCSDRD